jgi:hypothetical protein
MKIVKFRKIEKLTSQKKRIKPNIRRGKKGEDNSLSLAGQRSELEMARRGESS